MQKGDTSFPEQAWGTILHPKQAARVIFVALNCSLWHKICERWANIIKKPIGNIFPSIHGLVLFLLSTPNPIHWKSQVCSIIPQLLCLEPWQDLLPSRSLEFNSDIWIYMSKSYLNKRDMLVEPYVDWYAYILQPMMLDFNSII